MKKLILVLIGCFLATGALAETRGFQLSLTPDLAIHSRSTQIEGATLGLWSENPQNAFALGIVNGSTGNSSGLSLGFGNYSDNYRGAQLALVNYAKGEVRGLQWGGFNYAAKLHGLQLGFINYAESSDQGVQIGFVNIMNQTKNWFKGLPDELTPAMVFVNWRL